MELVATDPPAGPGRSVPAVDLVVGVASYTVRTTVTTAGAMTRVTRSWTDPLVRVAARGPMRVPLRRPAGWLRVAARQGASQRVELAHRADRLLDRVLPLLVAELMRHLDLTDLVMRYVDLDSIVSRVDLDAAVGKLDVDAVAGRLDVESLIKRLDLTEIVREGLDVNGLVADVDLDAAVARVDIEAVISRLDLAGLARDVIDAVDLPEIIRESTGAMASDTLRGVRMQSISGDDAIGRVVDRILMRRSARKGTPDPVVPAQPAGPPVEQAADPAVEVGREP